MPPPTPLDRLTGDQLGNVRHRSTRRLQQHAVLDQRGSCTSTAHPSHILSVALHRLRSGDDRRRTRRNPRRAGQLELRRFPYPENLEPGAVLLKMLASGICGTDKHTFRGETQQYAGTDHASSTPFPIIQGHENVGIVTAIGDGGATAFDGIPLQVGDRVVPAPNRACGRMRVLPRRLSRTTSAADSRTTATR